ncbi:MAG: ATP synthase F1 subunit delta [Bacteroidetes bacterium]|nr:ATP synthase F1 subunit delta [Bacteroidota bacterium]
MYNSKVAMRYAEALFCVSKEQNNLEVVLDELLSISKLSKESQELRSLIISPIISDSKKEQLFEAIFKNKISDLTFDFLILLIRKNRINIINDIYISFNKLYYKEKGLLAVTVTTAIPLQEELKNEIINKLELTTNKKIIPTYIVDKTLFGGIVINIDDWVYDASIKRQLEIIHTHLIDKIAINNTF